MLKKRQNLSELEHRVCDRIDDVARALKATLLDKLEATKKFRLYDTRFESLMEMSVMILSQSQGDLGLIISKIAKGAKKLRNPSMLVSHIKTQKKLLMMEKEVFQNQLDEELHGSPEVFDSRLLSPTMTGTRNNRRHQSSSRTRISEM